ncbi:MAG: hypothetical protein UZ22_OP11002000744 [Microgenomates bacterium OLB23]|nr:MAG: hypothetical protein UZ22_OP11002000744 [Microgenomates bacterium OLB23]
MLSEIQKFVNIRNPLFKFFIFLSFFTAISVIDLYIGSTKQSDRLVLLQNFALCAGLGFIFFLITRTLLKIPTVNPFNVWISSLLIYLLLHPTNSPAIFVLAFAGMFLGKYFFKYMNMPVFNPTAFGLLLALYVSKLLVTAGILADSALISWWGADMQQNMFTSLPLLNILTASALLFGFFILYAGVLKKTTYAAVFFFNVSFFVFFIYNLIVARQPLETIHLVAQAFF